MTTRWLLDPVFSHTAAAGVGAVLILAALAKLRDIALFRAALDNYRLVPTALLTGVAWLIPLLELLAGGLLLPTSTRSWGAALGLTVLLIVSGAVAFKIISRSERIDCGCGSEADEIPISAALLARNAVLVALTWLAMQPVAERSTVWLDIMAVVLGTVFFLGLYQTVNLWLSHQPRLEEMRQTL